MAPWGHAARSHSLVCLCGARDDVAHRVRAGSGRAAPVDVAAVRREIRDEMSHDWTAQGRFHGERKIVSMGHVTQASAVVYTDDGGRRYAETWVRAGGAWQLKDVQPAG